MTNHTHAFALGLTALALCALAACSPPGQASDQTSDIDPPAQTAAVPPAPVDVDIADRAGADPAAGVAAGLPAIELGALQPPDIEGQLEGELRCGFADGDGQPLMIASANVGESEPIAALVKVAGVVETLTVGSGGYDRMVDGASYTGNGLIASITPQGEDMTPGEGLTWRAVFRLENATGDALDLDGVWSCGP